ncbi:hypothetical protein AB0I10_12315 [Streptomyces sp. NPDC050636]|uniref:hypothetical protein n=1 Tax=Streptomyces sp. NPDC050636 TaxID=3154510 RepID=UPI0034254728
MAERHRQLVALFQQLVGTSAYGLGLLKAEPRGGAVEQADDVLDVLVEVPGGLRSCIIDLLDAVMQDGQQAAGVLMDAWQYVQGRRVVDGPSA